MSMPGVDCRASEPTLLDMLTMRGEAEARNIGSIALVTRTTPITLVSTTVRTVAGSREVGACGISPVIAALLTRTSSPPAWSAINSAAAATLASSVTSSGTPNASAPAARSFSTAVSRRSRSRAPTPIRQPSAPRPAAISYPIPLFPPVTSAIVRSFTSSIIGRTRLDRPRPARWKLIPHGYRPWCAYDARVETRELRYFVAVAEELHFGRAAQRLTMAQPPLSRAIQQLERRLGVVLLHRTARAVALTEAASVLLHEARAVLDAVEGAAHRTRRAAAGP